MRVKYYYMGLHWKRKKRMGNVEMCWTKKLKLKTVILKQKTVYSQHLHMCKSTLQNSSSGQGSPLYITSGDISSTNNNDTAVTESRDTGAADCSDPVSDPGNKSMTLIVLFTFHS